MLLARKETRDVLEKQVDESSILIGWLSQEMARCVISTKSKDPGHEDEKSETEYEPSIDSDWTDDSFDDQSQVDEYIKTTDDPSECSEWTDDASDCSEVEKNIVVQDLVSEEWNEDLCDDISVPLPYEESQTPTSPEPDKSINLSKRLHEIEQAEAPNPCADKRMDISKELREIATSIYKTMGSQQSEKVYQKCLMLKMQKKGIAAKKETKFGVEYEGQLVGTRRADLLLTLPKQQVVIEIKAVQQLKPHHFSQLKCYMQCLKIDHGYLLNFPRDKGYPTYDESNGVKNTCTVLSGPRSLEHLPEQSRALRPHLQKRSVELLEVNFERQVQGSRFKA